MSGGKVALDRTAVIILDKIAGRGASIAGFKGQDPHAINKDVEDFDSEDYEPYDRSTKGLRLLRDEEERELRYACEYLLDIVHGEVDMP